MTLAIGSSAKLGGRTIRPAVQALVLGWSTLIAAPRQANAQVGLNSGLAQVALVVRVAPSAAIDFVGPARETGRQGTLREVSSTVKLSANSAYRLVVVG